MDLSEIKREAAHALEKSGFPLEKSHDCGYSWVGDNIQCEWEPWDAVASQRLAVIHPIRNPG